MSAGARGGTAAVTAAAVGGGREHRKGDWWRHWTLKKAVSVAAIAAGVMVMLGAAGAGIAYAKTPVPTDPQLSAIQSASTVYFSNNKTRVGQFGTVDRQTLLYSQIPAVLRNAVVAAEDKNFWHEGGISPTGILRAAYYDLTSSGGNLQGGSTITQQLVRNYYANIGTAQTMTRKVKEIFVAQKLAQSTSKERILKEYLNTVYFGGGAYGVGAAAQYYFGLAPSQINQITPAQAAMIAAMIQSPSYYSPNPKDGARLPGPGLPLALRAQRHGRHGHAVAAGRGQGEVPHGRQAASTTAGAVTAATSCRRCSTSSQHTYGYTQEQINTSGLHIVTTFSKPLMDSLYATVSQNRALMKAGTPPAPPFGAQVACGPRAACRVTSTSARCSRTRRTARSSPCTAGRTTSKTQYDNALQSRNQVGSSFKPYVLATAVKQGMNVQTSRLNGFSPLWIPPDSQPMTFASLKDPGIASDYEVQNDEVSNPNRPVSVVEATAMSLNTAYADLWHRVALKHPTASTASSRWPRRFGVDTTGERPADDARRGGHRARPGLAHRGRAGEHDRHAGRRRCVSHPARHQGHHRRQRHHPGQDRPDARCSRRMRPPRWTTPCPSTWGRWAPPTASA